jgi:hypothetical protein
VDSNQFFNCLGMSPGLLVKGKYIMALYSFGAGAVFGTPLTDAFGNTLAANVAAPTQFGVLQDVSIDISFDVKELFGQNQFPVAVGRGKGKLTGKAKFAQLNGYMLNSLFFGQTLAAGAVLDQVDTAGSIVAASLTPTVPGGGTWTRDLGVQTSARVPLRRVVSAPATGQYSVSAGVYTFAAADVGNTVFINYQYTATSTVAQKSTISNIAMGYAPTFICDLYSPFGGKALTLTMNSCLATKLTFATKIDDFMISEFDFSCFADASGNVMSYGLSE